MPKKIEIFFVAFIISIPLWWSANIVGKNVGDFLVWKEVNNNPQLLVAEANQIKPSPINENLIPSRNWETDELQIEAKSALSILINKSADINKNNDDASSDGSLQYKYLFKKNSDEKLPIASLTKLMSAIIVLETYDPSLLIEVSQEAVNQEGDSGQLKVGETFRTKDLLYVMLIESSNDAAYALSEVIGQQQFVDLMNLKARSLNLQNTRFANSTGLDDPNNYSTTEDLAKLTEYLLNNSSIWDILSKKDFDLYTPDGVFHHKMENTNELLDSIPDIIGGKTGFTDQAQGCLILVVKAPQDQGYLINIILGSNDRFVEMSKFIDWVKKAYQW